MTNQMYFLFVSNECMECGEDRCVGIFATLVEAQKASRGYLGHEDVRVCTASVEDGFVQVWEVPEEWKEEYWRIKREEWARQPKIGLQKIADLAMHQFGRLLEQIILEPHPLFAALNLEDKAVQQPDGTWTIPVKVKYGDDDKHFWLIEDIETGQRRFPTPEEKKRLDKSLQAVVWMLKLGGR